MGELGVRIAQNGALQVVAWCGECQRWSSSPINHAYLKRFGVAASDLPIVFDYRGQLAICSVRGCGSHDVELNHFAPQAIFGEEADEWPTAFLCRKHHAEWGNRVTPQLNPPPRRLRTTGV